MNLPKFNETFLPILEVLSDGKTLKARELIRAVEKRYYANLPEELLSQTTKSGDRLIENRIAWGKSYLKKGGLVHYPERGHVQITEKGMAARERNINLAQLHTDVINFYEPENQKTGPSSLQDDSTPQDLIDSGMERIEKEVKEELLTKLREMDPFIFEKVVGRLLKRMGYGEFIETSKSGDGGIDGIINEDQLGLDKIYLQAKRYAEKNKVRETEIRNFIGAMSGDTQKGIFVTTSSFDEKAKRKAREAHHTIVLVDGSRLADLMHKFNVGVQVRNIYEVKMVDMDFFDLEEV